MFKSNNILLAGVMAAGVLLAGCTKNEVVDYSAQTGASNYISFLPVSGLSSTKATAPVTSTFYPTDLTFGTFAYNETSSSYAGAYIYNAKVFCTNADNALNTGGKVWTTEKAYLWPKESTLTFYSYSPYSVYSLVTATKDGIIISKFDVASNQVDLMVADKVTGQSSNGSNAVGGTSTSTYIGVPTVFRHKLAYIAGFNVSTDADYVEKHTFTDNNNTNIVYGAKLSEVTTPDATTVTTYFQGNFYIDGIEFVNVYTTGTYTYSADGNNSATYNSPTETLETTRDNSGWSAYSDPTTMTWFTPSTGSTGIQIKADKTKNGIAGPNLNKYLDANDNTCYYLYVLPQDFKAENSKGAAQLKVYFHVTGTYYYVTATTDTDTDTITYTVEKEGEKVVDPKGSYAIIDLAERKDDNTATSAWNENKKITYDLTLGYKGSGDNGFNIIYWGPNVVTWDEEGWSIDYVNETAGN